MYNLYPINFREKKIYTRDRRGLKLNNSLCDRNKYNAKNLINSLKAQIVR